MEPKKVEIKDFKDLTPEQAEQVQRVIGNTDPYGYDYAVQGDRVVLAKAPKKGEEKNG